MRGRATRLKNPVIEVLLFQVAGVRYGVALGHVVGLVRDLSAVTGCGVFDPHVVFFEGRQVPVFPPEDFLSDVGPGGSVPNEAIIIDDGAGAYGIAVDCTENVVDVTPGSELYIFPPLDDAEPCTCRPWGMLTVAERPVLLLDLTRVGVH